MLAVLAVLAYLVGGVKSKQARPPFPLASSPSKDSAWVAGADVSAGIFVAVAIAVVAVDVEPSFEANAVSSLRNCCLGFMCLWLGPGPWMMALVRSCSERASSGVTHSDRRRRW